MNGKLDLAKYRDIAAMTLNLGDEEAPTAEIVAMMERGEIVDYFVTALGLVKYLVETEQEYRERERIDGPGPVLMGLVRLRAASSSR